jgi:uncharacterized membrane protein
MAVFFALLSSLFIGVNTIIIKKSLARANPFTVAALLTFFGAIIFWIVGAFALPATSFWQSPRGSTYFVIAGIFAPALVRWLFFASMNRVGASISSSILATIPAFAAVIAVIFLDERVSPPMALGLAMIVGGILVFQRDLGDNGPRRQFRRMDLALPLLGALVGSIAINLRKLGLEEINSPILGAVLGFSSALAVYAVIVVLSPTIRRGFRFRMGDMPFFFAGGLSLALGWLCIFYALSHGDVVLVAPLAGLYPIIVLILSVFLLRDVERVTRKTVIGCCIVMAGVLLVTLV